MAYRNLKFGKLMHTPRMHSILIGGGGVPCSVIAQGVKIPPVLFTRNLSFKKNA
jgi:hypothetical protein